MHCERLFDVTGIGVEVRREPRNDYPSQMIEEVQRLSAWVQDWSATCGERLRVRVIDPQFPEGVYKSLCHRIRSYPTFIINRRTKHTGWDREIVERLLADCSGRLDLG
jgi:hypothetical protein